MGFAMPWLLLYVGFPNRIGRSQWWLGMAAIGAIVSGAMALGGEQNPLVMLGAALASLAIFIPITIARLHDRNRSIGTALTCLTGVSIVGKIFGRMLDPDTKWSILMIVGGVLAAWMIIELGILRGTAGRNRYGDDPLNQTAETA
jgi:uncharacterized membrane protein YhaH (DUF805 family)